MTIRAHRNRSADSEARTWASSVFCFCAPVRHCTLKEFTFSFLSDRYRARQLQSASPIWRRSTLCKVFRLDSMSSLKCLISFRANRSNAWLGREQKKRRAFLDERGISSSVALQATAATARRKEPNCFLLRVGALFMDTGSHQPSRGAFKWCQTAVDIDATKHTSFFHVRLSNILQLQCLLLWSSRVLYCVNERSASASAQENGAWSLSRPHS